MFLISTAIENGLELVVLEDTCSKARVTVVPSGGAMLHSFIVEHDSQLLNIIDHYPDSITLNNSLEKYGFKSAKLSPFVCRLKHGKYHFGQNEYKVEKFFLGDHAIHGIIYDAPFVVEEQSANDDYAFVMMSYNYTGTDAGYPFNYKCSVRYELHSANKLTIATTVVNKDKGHIPIADGWHPYFTFGKAVNALQLEIQSLTQIEFDEGMIPTGNLNRYEELGSLTTIGEQKFDDCFELNFAECQPMAVLRDPVGRMQLEFFPDRSYPYLQVYTPPHRQSIAIENLSAIPDSFNNGIGLITLEPGGSKTFTTTYKITSLI